MKKLILFFLIIFAGYFLVREILAPHRETNELSLQDLPSIERKKALDELRNLYPEQTSSSEIAIPVPRAKSQVIHQPFFNNDNDDFNQFEKAQHLDERGNPVDLEEERGMINE